MNLRTAFVIAISLISFQCVISQGRAANEIKKDISVKEMKYLSSDALEGRRTGSAGNNAAAEFIAGKAAEAGVKPIPGQVDLFQKLEYLKISLTPDSSLISVCDTTGRRILTSRINPLMVPSDKVEIAGEVVFAGYGYMNSEFKYNDFAGLSLSDKIVIVMTRNPDLGGDGFPAAGEDVDESVEMKKLPMLLFSRPKAILYVSDPLLKEDAGTVLPVQNTYQLKPLFRSLGFNFSLNAYMINRETADMLLKQSGETLTTLQAKISSTKKPVSFTLPDVKAEIKIGVRKDTVTSSNIVGYIEGSDPVLKNECVIYTAHYDHVGVDGSGNVMNGANDNASGTIGLLNVARAFSSLEQKPLRSIVFLWTTGEEEGLHGSNYYVENPLFPLENTVADINFDMIGRSRRDTDVGSSLTGKIDITGEDTIKVISDGNTSGLVALANEACTKHGLTMINEGKGEHFSGSDHFPFYRKGIPALFFFTGLHKDYHRETDDFEFIDFEKLIRVSRAGFITGYTIASRPERPVFDTPRK